MDLHADASINHWRVAAFSLGFLLLAVCVTWSMRERSIAHDREQERAQWEADRLMAELREEQSREIGRLDLAADEVRREQYHRANPTTAKSVSE